jgi:hypothetical protein
MTEVAKRFREQVARVRLPKGHSDDPNDIVTSIGKFVVSVQRHVHQVHHTHQAVVVSTA